MIFLAFLEKQTRNLTIEQDRQQQRIFALEVLNKATSAVRPMSEYNGYILISKSGQRYRSNMEIAQKAGYTEQEIVALMSFLKLTNKEIIFIFMELKVAMINSRSSHFLTAHIKELTDKI